MSRCCTTMLFSRLVVVRDWISSWSIIIPLTDSFVPSNMFSKSIIFIQRTSMYLYCLFHLDKEGGWTKPTFGFPAASFNDVWFLVLNRQGLCTVYHLSYCFHHQMTHQSINVAKALSSWKLKIILDKNCLYIYEKLLNSLEKI